MGIQYQKVKSVAKQMLPRGSKLQETILKTLRTCSELVGATLGPGGMSVVIEHQETGMPPLVTKDGVTVFRALGFDDSSQHVLMEAARDAAIRTASEAGDGTTTATILAEAFVRKTQEFCNKNPRVSPQRVVRTLSRLFETQMVDALAELKIQPNLGNPEGREQLRAVAKISANGDTDLADAVMQCFDIIGDEGNVTITELVGPSKYIVQKIEGYPIPGGYEDSCGPFYQKFVNDPATQAALLEKPVFLLHHGRITDFNTLYPICNRIAEMVNDGVTFDESEGNKRVTHNVVVVATGFSETVLANLAAGFVQQGTLNVYPLQVPMFPVKSGQYDFLLDLAALTGAKIFDPLENPLQNFQATDLGIGPSAFEATRFRSNIIGWKSEMLTMERVEQVGTQLEEAAVSELEKTLLRERLAKLTSGIAKLVVQGSSHGEIKERRDRAEDAVCAVRGAIKHGALPGGGAALKHLALNLYLRLPHDHADEVKIAVDVAWPAMLEPVLRLYANAGYSPTEAAELLNELEPHRCFDVLESKWVDPVKEGLLDSLPAVREALRNSISIAGLLGTCGGTVVFKRDAELERTEARDTADFLRNANINEANERG